MLIILIVLTTAEIYYHVIGLIILNYLEFYTIIEWSIGIQLK